MFLGRWKEGMVLRVGGIGVGSLLNRQRGRKDLPGRETSVSRDVQGPKREWLCFTAV